MRKKQKVFSVKNLARFSLIFISSKGEPEIFLKVSNKDIYELTPKELESLARDSAQTLANYNYALNTRQVVEDTSYAGTTWSYDGEVFTETARGLLSLTGATLVGMTALTPHGKSRVSLPIQDLTLIKERRTSS